MIVKALTRGLLNQQTLFNFAKAASSQANETVASLKKGQISQVIGAVVDVQF